MMRKRVVFHRHNDRWIRVPVFVTFSVTKPSDQKVTNTTCAACLAHRCHTSEEWKNHPRASHGFTEDTGWTGPFRDRNTKPAA